MRHNYLTIKDEAKESYRKVTDLLALSPSNDPFYVGTPADWTNARWFAAIWKKAGYTSGVHLRRVHYYVVSQDPPIAMPDGRPYENTERCWDFIVSASKKARYLGLVKISQIVDHKNPPAIVHADYLEQGSVPGFDINVPQLNDPYVWVSGLRNANVQPYHLEVWCEKSTMNDVLVPATSRFGANLLTFEGEVSITACHDLINRIKASGGKPTRIFYISDFDPAGNSMPVAMSRKVEFLLDQLEDEYDVRVKPIMLTTDQVVSFKLPRTPIKETEKRAGKFEAAFGTGAVELDAMEALWPGELSKIVRGELKPYYNEDAEKAVRAAENDIRSAVDEKVQDIVSQYKDEIAALQGMIERLESVELDTSEFVVDQFEPEVDEDDSWLFDSTRPYEDQIAHYKAHKTGETL